MLGAIVHAGERGMTRDEISAAVAMSLTSSSFANYLSNLHSLQLVAKGSDGRERASKELLS